MPTYTIRNKEFGTEKDVFCTYSELQEMLKSDDIEQVLSAPALVGDHIVKQGDGKMDGGMKEVFSKIGEGITTTDSIIRREMYEMQKCINGLLIRVKELAEENYELKKRVMPDLSDKIPEVTGK